jgi:Arm DNA-binding domain
MARTARPLTALQVERLDRPGRHSVGTVAGLHLRILPPPSSTRVWTLRVVVDSQRRDINLGWYPDISLKQASEAARAKRLELFGDTNREDGSKLAPSATRSARPFGRAPRSGVGPQPGRS